MYSNCQSGVLTLIKKKYIYKLNRLKDTTDQCVVVIATEELLPCSIERRWIELRIFIEKLP